MFTYLLLLLRMYVVVVIGGVTPFTFVVVMGCFVDNDDNKNNKLPRQQ